ncbi:MAG: shikimate dehydrogenase [Leptospiraceae bacterium]|nr:shikimate dehydrogenase [Leptospiraceae bacterium]
MEIRGSSRVYGILGHPVKHSLSPLLHNLAFRSSKLDAVYIPLDVKETGPFLKRALLALDLGGLSVTIPHKIWAYRMSDKADRLSQICGASNTLLFSGKDRKSIEARNSDGPGAIQALKEVSKIKGKTALICGYGGSARAIAAQLLLSEKPSEIWITGRNEKKIKSFIRALKKQFPGSVLFPLADGASSLPQHAPGRTRNVQKPDIIIQTTPLGMSSTKTAASSALPLHPAILAADAVVFDIVYSPMITPLIALAKKRKCKVVFGYKMLLYQAVYQYKWFTGREPPVKKWETILQEDLRSKEKGSRNAK